MTATSTIVAVSTGSGRAGVAVVRVSGRDARFVLETIAGSVPPPRQAVLRRLRDRAGEEIDKALVLYFPSPASFTGEDVVEFHTHGSRAVLSRLLVVLTALPNLRLAEPGEFTRRAFEAGKLDLAEVEGLADLIDSDTEWQRRQALRQMDGALGAQVERWRTKLIEAMALLAAELDFSDEADVSGPLVAQAVAPIAAVRADLMAALGGFARGERVRDGFVIVLSGPPNAGKSSLLNALARRDVAIVSPIAGTTRDAIEIRLDLDGIPVRLVDTAGLRDSIDPVEAEGVRRAHNLMAGADLVLRLRPIDSQPDRSVIDDQVMRIATKADLEGAALSGELPVSAATGKGMEVLLDAIIARLGAFETTEPALLTRQRHRDAVMDAVAALDRALAMQTEHVELIAEDVRLAGRALERLVGRVDVEDVLDQLFAGFCIGK